MSGTIFSRKSSLTRSENSGSVTERTHNGEPQLTAADFAALKARM